MKRNEGWKRWGAWMVCVALSAVAAVGQVAPPSTNQQARVILPAPTSGPLVLTGENTLIVSRGGGATLQKYLREFATPPVPAGSTNAVDPKYFPLLRDDNPKFSLPEGRTIVVSVGDTQYVAKEDREEMARNGWNLMLKRKGNVILVLGEGRAEIEFLEQVAGIRAYAPEHVWWSRPKDGRITVPADYVFGRKIAFYSSYYSGAAEPRNFEWRNYNYMANSQNGLLCYHNIAALFPPSKYGKTHPEIYSMNTKGIRVIPEEGATAWNPCYSAKALPDLAMDYIRERARNNPQYGGTIVMGIMDHGVECYCPDCQASLKKTGGYSNVHWEFVNEVARRCQKEFPNVRLTAFFYINVGPPVGMKLEPNITVKVVTKSIWWSDPTKRPNLIGEMEAAGVGLGCSWWIHDWCFSGVSPRNITYDYAEFLKWGKEKGMVGAYIEWSNGQSWYLDGAKYYIIMQLMKDPTQDVRAMWRRYADDLFGAGADEMFQLHEHFAQKMKTAYQQIELGVDVPRWESAMYSPEDLALERKLIEKAMAKTKKDPLIQQRFVPIMRYFTAHEMMASAVYEPYQLNRHFKGPGVNRPLLAFYVNEDGSKAAAAYDYVQTKMTLPPDTRNMEDALGANASYASCYSMGINAVLEQCRRPALASADAKTMDAQTFARVAETAKQTLRDNLPKRYRKDRVEFLEAMLAKNLVLPTAPALPVIDGDLSDDAWKSAAELKDFTERGTYRVPKHQTSGKVMRVGDQLVFGIECRQVGPIVVKTKKETLSGGRLWKESSMEFHFGVPGGTNAEKATMAQYVVNANGAYQGFRASRDNRDGCQVETKLDAEKGVFTIEAVFPLKASGYDFSQSRILLLNLMRDVFTTPTQAEDAIITWYPTPYTCYADDALGLVFSAPRN